MGFFSQLLLLIWKNFTIRKRQKVRCLVEIIWPLFLIFILTWIRQTELKKYVHECHFQSKAMPSTGQVPFIASYLCSFNNTCHRTMDAASVGLDAKMFSSSLPELVQKIMVAGTTDLDNNYIIRNLTEDLSKLATVIQRLNGSSPYYNDVLMNKEEITAARKLETEKNETLRNLYRRIVPLLCDKYNSSQKDLSIISKQLCELSKVVLNMNEPITDSKANSAAVLFDKMLSQMDLLLTDSEKEIIINSLENILNYTADWSLLQNLNRDSNKIETRYEQINTLVQRMNISSFFTNVIFASQLLCGDDNDAASSLMQLGSKGSERVETLKEFFDEKQTFDDYIYDNEASVACNDLFKTLEMNAYSRYFWLEVKPFFRGKILFTPNNIAVRKVMNVLESYVLSMEEFKQTLKGYKNVTLPEIFKEISLLLNNISIIKDLVYAGNVPFLKDFLENGLDTNRSSESTGGSFLSVFNQGEYLHNYSTTYKLMKAVNENISNILDCFETSKLLPFDSEEEAMEKGMELLNQDKFLALIVFADMDSNSTKLPSLVTYKIRMDSSRVDDTNQIQDLYYRPGPRRRPEFDLKYITFGFAYLQDIIEHAIIKIQTGETDVPGIYLQQFPYPCYIIDRFVRAIANQLPLIMNLCWVYTCSMIVKSIVYEKERRLKETMRVMGLGNTIHWIGWFIDSFLPMLVAILLMALILKFGKVTEKSDPTVIFLFFVCNGIASISMSFLISVFFSKSNTAAAAGGLIYFLLYLPYPLLRIWRKYITSKHKILASLFSNVAFGYGCTYIALYEESGTGIQWNNVYRSPMIDDEYNMMYVMYMLLLDTIIYFMFTWYIENVFPGQYGIPKPFYFPFTRSYWLSDNKKVFVNTDEELATYSSRHFEKEPEGLVKGVILVNLSKRYKQYFAVNNLSLNFYEDQITAFLGHNGAGKTTTISIITGLFPPTSGTVKIYGLDIQKDMDLIRQSMGVCPQHNILFDYLTVEEHLWFFATLKGQTKKASIEEIPVILEDMELYQKRFTLSSQLSGGMKRKLSIGAAFVGGSRTIILDEPTSGVDPFSRRSIWELLVKYKKGRTIILTTHFMDEADLLGDRIAIISHGKLKCCGSSLFLKANFGKGYYLTISLKQINYPGPSVSSKEDDGSFQRILSEVITNIDTLIRKTVPDAEMTQHLGLEVIFALPVKNDPNILVSLFNFLDANLESLYIQSYGISDTSLEEIFLTITELNNLDTYINEGSGGANQNNGDLPSVTSSKKIGNEKFVQKPYVIKSQVQPQIEDISDSDNLDQKISVESQGEQASCQNVADSYLDNAADEVTVIDYKGFKVMYKKVNLSDSQHQYSNDKCSKWKQYSALQIKHYHHTRRNKKGLFCELILPSIFILFSLLFTAIFPKLEMPPALEINPWVYGFPNYVFFSNENPLSNSTSSSYEKELVGSIGMGTGCIKSSLISGMPCKAPNITGFSVNSRVDVTPSCSCEIGTQQCPAAAGGPHPPEIVSPTGDLLLNLTLRNITDWLIKTEEFFFEQRYGGFTFGITNILQNINLVNLSKFIQGIWKNFQLSNSTSFLSNRNLDGSNNIEINVLRDISNNIKVWFFNKGWIASVAYMNAVNNIILRASLPNDLQIKKSEYGIKLINHPMNFTKKQMESELEIQSVFSLMRAICVIFSLSFVPASFLVFLVEEKMSKFKLLQCMAGVDQYIYWIAEFCWDMAGYSLSALICIFIFLIFDEQAYVSSRSILALILLLFFYGWAIIPMMYPFSYLFSVTSSAFVTMACVNMFIGVVTTISTFMLSLMDDDDLVATGKLLSKIFLIFPQFCLGEGLMTMAGQYHASQFLANYGVQFHVNVLSWNFIGKNLFALFWEGITFFVFTLFLEYKVYRCFSLQVMGLNSGQVCKHLPSMLLNYVSNRNVLNIQRGEQHQFHIDESTIQDEDIIAEQNRVQSGLADHNVLVMKNLTKIYNITPAVNNLSLGISEAECFGLLGLNGAGKTTTMKMLTGDIKPTSGEAFIAGRSILTKLRKAQRHIGYCPQFDALDPLLSPKQHIEFFYRLKGKSHNFHQEVCDSLKKMNLSYYADRLTGTLSGGNKRKLSTAIALVGNPDIIFLDEPTSGMDPKARRFLWTCILNLVAEGHSVVLTSHSMEECEALCTRLTIMVDGRFLCLGSCQHLKNKYGQGYILIVRCHPNQMPSLMIFMESRFSSIVVQEKHYTQVKFHLAQSVVQLSHVFSTMEEARNQGIVEDYSVSQTNLEEVFLKFAQAQGSSIEGV